MRTPKAAIAALALGLAAAKAAAAPVASDDGVFVIDSTYLPSRARADVKLIRKQTVMTVLAERAFSAVRGQG